MGEVEYADGSAYAGEFYNGNRHGHGVFSFVDDYGNKCRYEGSWKDDRRDGVGLLLGGAYRFLIGRYESDMPVRCHIAFDYDSHGTKALDMEFGGM